jgi:hypothetical protein
MGTPRRSLKPIYVQTVGRVRLLVWPRQRGASGRDPVVSIERTQDEAAPVWYPSASFGVGDLADLESLLRVVRAHLDGGHPPAADGDPARQTANPAPGTTTVVPTSEDGLDHQQEYGEESVDTPTEEPSSASADPVTTTAEPTEKLFSIPERSADPIVHGLTRSAVVRHVHWEHRAYGRLRARLRALRDGSRS